MRSVIADRRGMVAVANLCRCSRQIQSSLDAAILDPNHLEFATHAGVDGPIAVGTLDRAAQQLDELEGIAEIFRTDPTFGAPHTAWAGLKKAAPDLFD